MGGSDPQPWDQESQVPITWYFSANSGEAISPHSHTSQVFKRVCFFPHLLKSVAFCAFQEPIKICKMFQNPIGLWKALLCRSSGFCSNITNCVTLGKYLTFYKRDIIDPSESMHWEWMECPLQLWDLNSLRLISCSSHYWQFPLPFSVQTQLSYLLSSSWERDGESVGLDNWLSVNIERTMCIVRAVFFKLAWSEESSGTFIKCHSLHLRPWVSVSRDRAWVIISIIF